MESKTDVELWLALKFVPRLAIHKKLALVERFGLTVLFSVANKTSILTSANNLSAKQLHAFYHPDWLKITSVIQQSYQCNSTLISYDNPCYPQLLKEIYDPPLVLFVQGNTALLNEPQIAIVGSRAASVSGRESAFHFSQQLAEQKFFITSGLALGIDAAAHRGALNTSGKTIAVVATGLDNVYPARHKMLAQQIIASGGLVVSEFIPGTQARAGHFPKRNRLISGLSLGVLVVEAELKSGSLITARCALEQGREVFAVPSSIENKQAKGCHWLIKQGAKLVEGCADIIDELVFLNKANLHLNDKLLCLTPKLALDEGSLGKGKDDLKPEYNDVLLESIGFEITPIDKIVLRSKVPIDQVLTRLTILELSGQISAIPGGYIRMK